MRILDKYIIKELMGPFLFGVASFTSIFIGTGTMFRIAQYVTQYGASMSSVVKLFIYSLPPIVVVTFPMSMLLAALLAFGRLSGSSEITAMRSGGISFFRLAAPVFVVALLVSIFSVGFSELVVPYANEAYNNTVQYEIMRKNDPKSQEHIIIKNISQGNLERLTYSRRYEEREKVMKNVSVQEFSEGRVVRIENAERAEWKDGRWIMYNGVMHDLNAEGKMERTLHFDQQILPMEKTPADIAKEQKKPEEMTIRELNTVIDVLHREYVNANLYEVELHQRFAIPLASLVFTMIGTPLGLQPNRSSSSIGLGISIIIIFVYYIIMTTSIALGQGGALPPMLSAWLPNLLMITVGSYLVYKASR